jgi:hypothetical protein
MPYSPKLVDADATPRDRRLRLRLKPEALADDQC